MIHLLSCSVNAKTDSPFPASGTRPMNFHPDRDLRPYADMLRGSTFECLHWSELLDRYALQPRTISCLVYCDPPYVVTETGAHYRHCFDRVDHILLARKLTDIHQRNDAERRVRIIVSYDDDEDGYIRSLYRPEFGWHVKTVPIQYRSGHHASATQELLITNFKMGEKQ